MFTSNLTQYINENNENISPLTNIDTLYYERAYKVNASYYIVRENMVKHMPIGYTVTDISQYIAQAIKYVSDTSDIEKQNGSILYITGDISIANVSIDLNKGYAYALNNYNTYKVYINENEVGAFQNNINMYINNYETKYCTDISIKDLSINIEKSLNIIQRYDASIQEIKNNIINASIKINTVQLNINNINVRVNQLNASINKWSQQITDPLLNATSQSKLVNSLLYTHEALWQLIANNQLIPGNVYNLLYYPEYDTSLIASNQIKLGYSATTNKVYSTIINSTGPSINTNISTYKRFPYILKVTAVSECQLSDNVEICDYKTTMQRYIRNLSIICNGIISQNILQYINVWDFNAVNNLGRMPVLLDIIVHINSNHVNDAILVMYDHKYGYIFGLANNISNILQAFTQPLSAIYVMKNNIRYNLDAAIYNIYNRYIFKKVSNVQSLNNCICNDKDFNNLINFLSSQLSVTSEFISNKTVISINDICNRSSYKAYSDLMNLQKWQIKYDYYTNSFKYLKDEYGNEGYYDFWNKYIIYTSGSSAYKYYTFNIVQYANNNNIIFSNNQNLLFTQLLQNKVLVYNNKIKNNTNTYIMGDGNYTIANNVIANCNNVILYNQNNQNINNCENVILISNKLNMNSGMYTKSNNMIFVNTYSNNIDNMNVSTNYQISYALNSIVISGYTNNMLIQSSNINLQNNICNGICIQNSSYINICYNTIQNNISLNQISNINLYKGGYSIYNTYNIKNGNAFIFTGDIIANSSGLF